MTELIEWTAQYVLVGLLVSLGLAYDWIRHDIVETRDKL